MPLYALLNIIFVIFTPSAWFWIYAVYFLLLAVMRFLLLRTGIGRSRIAELKRSRLCGILLLTLNLTLSSAVLMMLYRGKGFEYPGFLIYAVALYTFYITTYSIIELVKNRRHTSPVLTTSKAINLSAALFSMLSLESAMLSQFGRNMTHETKYLFIALTGAGVSLIIISISVLTILYTTKEIRKWKTKNSTIPTPQRSRRK